MFCGREREFGQVVVRKEAKKRKTFWMPACDEKFSDSCRHATYEAIGGRET
jgi:hypothetical protein